MNSKFEKEIENMAKCFSELPKVFNIKVLFIFAKRQRQAARLSEFPNKSSLDKDLADNIQVI